MLSAGAFASAAAVAVVAADGGDGAALPRAVAAGTAVVILLAASESYPIGGMERRTLSALSSSSVRTIWNSMQRGLADGEKGPGV